MRFIPAAVTPVLLRDIFSALWAGKSSLGLFERELASYLGHSHAYTFPSLMRAVSGCLIALKRRNKKKVVVLPRYCCPSFIHGVVAAGLVPKFCDIDPVTLAIDEASLESNDLSDGLALICTNLFGLTSNPERVRKICRDHDLIMIEGVDYGLGTEIHGRRIGSWGDVAILNFQEGKAIPVGGGAVVTSMEAMEDCFANRTTKLFQNIPTMIGYSIFSRPSMYYFFMRLVAVCGIDRKRFSMEDTIRRTSSEIDFELVEETPNQSISCFQAALGSRLLERLSGNMKDRQRNVQSLLGKLDRIEEITAIRAIPPVNNIHPIRLGILVDGDVRDELINELLSKRIEASPMYVEHGMEIDSSVFRGAWQVSRELITLPCHPYVSEGDISEMCSVIDNFLSKDKKSCI